ncbi:MAG: cell division/cell wall cluster transcriptional repressor MraZ [Gammaproteobacteria bacterium]|nr:MAG: cell division/cell wall cluster transcriptional repressor MraZ [Gammaproteobacteria bacterium]
MFRGASSINLDAKGRIAIPAKYRERLRESCDSQVIVTIDLEQPCLSLFPLPHWEQLERQLQTLSNTNPVHQSIKRLLLGHACECELDKNGRVLLPAVLREHAGFSKHLMLAGMGSTFQIWDEEKWNERIRQDMEAHATQTLDPDKIPDLKF